MLSQRTRRQGFTLIELLTVMAIIGVLMSLLLVGVFSAWRTVKIAGARNDLSQMSNALQNFKQKYGFYPPDQIRLCSDRSSYTNANLQGSLDATSVNFIVKMFKDIGKDPTNKVFTNNWTKIQWVPGNNAVDVTLEGDQCLVFFLGGIPLSGGAPQGFSTNPLDPSDLSIAGRVGPFYQFNTSQLQGATGTAGNITRSKNATTASSAGFRSYFDVWGQMPYVYFSANNTTNGYFSAANLKGKTGYTANTFTIGSTNVGAYFSAVGTYYQPTTYQIVCAGPDGTFGPGGGDGSGTAPGGRWTPQTAVNDATGNEADDMTDFYGAAMGVSQ